MSSWPELLRLALRNLGRHRRRTAITALSITFGVGLTVFMESMATGMYDKLTMDATRMQGGTVTVQHPDYMAEPAVGLYVPDAASLQQKLGSLPGVDSTKRTLLAQAVGRTGKGAAGISLMGVEPEAESLASPIAKKMISGRYLLPGDRDVVVIGHKLARRLSLDLGKKMVLTSSDAEGNITERLLRVRGIFETGSTAFDAYLVQAPIDSLVEMYGLPSGSATQVGVMVQELQQLDQVLAEVRAQLGTEGSNAYPWQEVMPALANYIRSDHGALVFITWILIFLTLFTILNTVSMSVLEREREFCVLMALGTPLSRLRLQVVVETLLIGALGTGLGVLIGALVAWHYGTAGLDMAGMYSTEEITVGNFAIDMVLYPKVRMEYLLQLGLGVWLISGLTALPGMRRLGRIEVANRLRAN